MITILVVAFIIIFLKLRKLHLYSPNKNFKRAEAVAVGLVVGIISAIVIGTCIPSDKSEFVLDKLNVTGISGESGKDLYLAVGNMSKPGILLYSFIYFDQYGKKTSGTIPVESASVISTSGKHAKLAVYGNKTIDWFTISLNKTYVFMIPRESN